MASPQLSENVVHMAQNTIQVHQLNVRLYVYSHSQCFGSGLDPDSIMSVDPDMASESGSGYRRAIFSKFWSSKPCIGIQPKMLDPDPE